MISHVYLCFFCQRDDKVGHLLTSVLLDLK